MGAKRPYDHEGADKLENYVRNRYPAQLSNGAMHLYLVALPYLEKQGLGLCQPITANYKTLASASCKDESGLRKLLNELNGVLCEVVIGSTIKEDRKATQIRRYTIGELRAGRVKQRLVDETPATANQLATQLNERPFAYGSEAECRPFWNVSRTGRVISKQPNVQGDSADLRIRNLCCGLKSGQVLIHLDIEQAEPSIIRQLIGVGLPQDAYAFLAEIMGISRDEAKTRLNALAYSSSQAVKVVQRWPVRAQEVFMPYAQALDRYKQELWIEGQPAGKRRRYVRTLGGTQVCADRGERAHRGQILNWHVQGTMADILNAASLRVMEMEGGHGWRYCFPIHDAMYVIGHQHHTEELKSILEEEARRLNLDLNVRVEEF